MSNVPPESTPALSVVVPFFEEGDAATQVVAELRGVLAELGRSSELILVDDGSTDDTWAALQRGSAGAGNCKLVRLARNCGQTAALAAGIDRADGDVIVILDGDGQNDPHDIPALLAKLDEGYDVVSGWRRKRQDTFITRRVPSMIANALIARLSGVAVHDLGCSLKAYRRPFLKDIRLYGEMHRFVVIHAVWGGGRLAEIEVNHRARTTGLSKYGLERTFKVILDLLVMVFLRKYITKPIYLFGGFGLLSTFCAMLAGGFAVVFKLAKMFEFLPPSYRKDFVQSPLPLLSVMFGLVGALSVLMGLLAEMLTRTYHESQSKPVYSLAIEEGAAPAAPAPVPAADAAPESPSVPTS